MLTKVQQQLVTDNHSLIYGYADKHKLDLDEFYGILALALCKAAQHFDESKGKFSTVVYTCMGNAVRNYYKAKENKSKLPLVYLDADYTDNDSENELLSNVITSFELQPDQEVEGNVIGQILLAMLSDKEREIVEDRLKGMTEKQIAQKMGCTHQNVHSWINKIRKKWTKFYLLHS